MSIDDEKETFASRCGVQNEIQHLERKKSRLFRTGSSLNDLRPAGAVDH